MSQEKSWGEEIVMVPVPRRLLPKVYRTLSEGMSEEASAPVESAPEPADPDEDEEEESGGYVRHSRIDWTDVKNCKKLRAGVNAAGYVNEIDKMLDYLASRPGEWVPFSEIADAVGRTRDQLQGDTRSLTRIIKKVFGKDKGWNDWPIDKEWGKSGESQRDYRMTAEIAKAWRASAV